MATGRADRSGKVSGIAGPVEQSSRIKFLTDITDTARPVGKTHPTGPIRFRGQKPFARPNALWLQLIYKFAIFAE